MIETVPETGSTNGDLVERLRAGEQVPEGFWLRAEQQTGGRGRLGRPWVSPKGNLFCSTVVSVLSGDPLPHSLSFVTALAVYDTLKRSLLPNAEILLKWPNDVLVHGCKICGILLERRDDTIVVGVGVNVCHAPVLTDRKATSILYENGKHGGNPGLVLEILAESFAARLTQWRSDGMAATLTDWGDRTHGIGDKLRVTGSDGEKVDGAYDGIKSDGALQLRLLDGTHTTIYAGDVTLD